MGGKRGISVVSVAMNPITLKEEDLKKIQEIQDAAVLRDPTMMAATLGSAQAEAMKAAASNPNGAMMGFMGLNMAGGAGSANIQDLLQMGNQRQQAQRQQQYIPEEKQAQLAEVFRHRAERLGLRAPEGAQLAAVDTGICRTENGEEMHCLYLHCKLPSAETGYSILLGRASNADQNLLRDAQQILDTLAG